MIVHAYEPLAVHQFSVLNDQGSVFEIGDRVIKDRLLCSKGMQDAFQPIPGLISCAGVTGNGD